MMKIIEVWNELENDSSFERGLLIRRLPTNIVPDIYIAIWGQEKLKCLALKLKQTTQINFGKFNNLKAIKIGLYPDDKNPDKNLLVISLSDRQHVDIFAIICNDLVNGVMHLNDELRVVRELLNRLEKWKGLFDKASTQGLSSEEQRGLYGELYFLRKLSSTNPNYQENVDSWIGPQGELRDFQVGGSAVEVKTTSGNNHQQIQISNERQLDASQLEALFLFHLSLEVQLHNGETLNQLVDSLLLAYGDDYIAFSTLKMKLLEAGYFEHHRPAYDNTGYQRRIEAYFKVSGNFPRIEERELRSGVGDVKYSIVLSQHDEYLVEEDYVLNTLKTK